MFADVLLDRHHQLRSGWRFAAFIILFLLIWIATGLALSIVYQMSPIPDTQLALLLLNAAALFVPAVGTTFFMVRMIDHTQLAAFGILLHKGWLKDWAAGFGIAAGMLAIVTLAALLFGGATIHWNGANASASRVLATAALLFVAAANEEIVFRGYPMQVLMKGIGPWPAVFTMSALFGMLHLSNPDASALSTTNTVLAGLLLSVAYLKTRSLWLPYGLHLGWNLGLGVIMGYPVSGLPMDSVWSTSVHGPLKMFGGPYGPEGGLIGTIVFIVAVVTVRRMKKPTIGLETQAALKANAEKIYISEN